MSCRELQEWGVVEESPKHVITVVEIDSPGWDRELMYKLYIKTCDDRWFSFRRAAFADYGLRELQGLVERYNPDDGFFCTHGKGRPLKEFDDEDDGLKALPLEPFTSLENTGEYWAFSGNHKHYSGAFGYKIFSKNIAQWVYECLKCDEARAPPDQYCPRVYSIEL